MLLAVAAVEVVVRWCHDGIRSPSAAPGALGLAANLPVSNLFPRVRECADELCVIRSMVSEFSEHTAANYFLHTGAGLAGRPSAGAWLTYGLGTENSNLPGFVVLNGGLVPPGGSANFGSGFLPAAYQASILKSGALAAANIVPGEPTRIYGRQCLLARRMVERGVRFIELTCPVVGGDRWDQHGNLKEGHENNARAVNHKRLSCRFGGRDMRLTDVHGEAIRKILA